MSFTVSTAAAAVGVVVVEVETWLIQLVAALGLLDVVLIAQFFRIPKRVLSPKKANPVTSTARVWSSKRWRSLKCWDKRIQVSIFMSPLNVHAQWRPWREVTHANYHLASISWLSTQEQHRKQRTTLVINESSRPGVVPSNRRCGCSRIRWYIEPGQRVELGEEVGSSNLVLGSMFFAVELRHSRWFGAKGQGTRNGFGHVACQRLTMRVHLLSIGDEL